MKDIAQILLLIFLITNSVCSQNLEGRFEGAVSRDGSIQLVNFEFYLEDGVQKGTYEIPEVGYFDVPIDKIIKVNDTLNIKFYYGNFQCFLDEKNKQIIGISEKWDPKIRLHVKEVPKKEKPYTKRNIVFKNRDIQLEGMIYDPINKIEQNTKYVILVHGSGAQDRFSPYYISLGHSLAKNGFGVLLYDKRGTGLSTGNFEISSMEDLADDAISALNYIKNRGDIKESEIGFLGTSQGGWVSSIAANKSKDCDFLILNVGPAVSVFEQDIHRVKYSMKGDGKNESDIGLALAYTDLYFEFADNNDDKTRLKLDKLSKEVSKKNWAEYVNMPNKDDFKWWRNNNYNPEKDLKNLRCRTLSLFGEFDPLVPPEENEKLMREYLTVAGIEFDIKVIHGTLPDMKTYQGLNDDNWNWPHVYWEWRIQPVEFTNSITQFLNKK